MSPKPAAKPDTPSFSWLDACGHEMARHMEQSAKEYLERNPRAKHPRTLVTAAIMLLYRALKTEPNSTEAKKGLSRAYAQVLDLIEKTAMAFFGKM